MADNVLRRQKSPDMGVVAVVAIVAQDKDEPFRHLHPGDDVLRWLGRVGFLQGLPVYEYRTVVHFHLLPFGGNYPFNKDLIGSISLYLELLGRFKYDNIARMRRMKSIGHFLDHEAIANVQGREHRIRGNIARLGNKDSQHDRQDNGDRQRNQV